MERGQLETWELGSAGLGWVFFLPPRVSGMFTCPLRREGEGAVKQPALAKHLGWVTL